MANDKRGEVEITIGGKSYTMRLTFDALAKIEGATGKSIVVLTQQAMSFQLAATELRAIIVIASKAAGNAVESSAIEDEMMDKGVANGELLRPVGELLAIAVTGLSGGEKSKGDGKEGK